MYSSTVEEYIFNSGKWEDMLILLREIVRDSGLEETMKWGMPVYTLENKNVVGIVAFKRYAGLWFYQGVFLKDRYKLLIAGDQETSAMRQWRFQDIDEVRDQVEYIVEYLEEAMENMRQGKIKKPDMNKPIVVPEELQIAFDNDPHLKESYYAMSKSNRRNYARYIDQAKQAETRQRRLQKIIGMIKND